MINQNNKQLWVLLGCAVILVTVFLRAYQLQHQGVILFDTAAFVFRADVLKMIVTSEQAFGQSYGYIDSKILWLTLILLGKLFVVDADFTVLLLSCVFGCLTVWLTYFFAARFYRSKVIGLLSAAFLSVSSYHIFYSRVGFPEAASGFFVLLSVYLYLRAIEKKWTFALAAGAALGAAFLLNAFRMGLVPLFVLALEMYFWLTRRDGYRFDKLRFVIFCLTAGITVFVGSSVLYGALNHFGVVMPSYIFGLKHHLSMHTDVGFDPWALLSFPYFIWFFEGAGFYLLLVFSALTFRKNYSAAFPLFVVLIQGGIFSLTDQHVARVLSIVLPFLSMIAAVSVYHLYQMAARRKVYRALMHVFVLFLFLESALRAYPLTQMRTSMPEAVAWVNKQDPQAGIISTHTFATALYSKSPLNENLFMLTPDELRMLSENGFKYILINHDKFRANETRLWNDPLLAEPIASIETRCVFAKEWEDYSEYLQEILAYEHNTHLSNTFRLVNRINIDLGKIRVYELKACLDKL